MKKNYSVDTFLLEKFQKMSDHLQDHIGINNFTISKILRMIMIVVLVLREVIAFNNGIDSTEFIVMACSVMVIVKMDFMSNKAERNVKNKFGFMNSVVSEYAITRIIMQFIAIASFGFLIKHLYYVINPPVSVRLQYDELKELFWNIFGMLMFFVAYFSSCTPKPYKPSKARKLIENARAKQAVSSLSLNKLL